MLAAKTYLGVLDGYSLEAIASSVDQFVRGAVETHDGRFAPSAAELSRNVRKWDEAFKLRDAPRRKLASGIMSVDFGGGRIDMTKLSLEQQNEVLRTGKPPQITVGPTTVKLQRMGEKTTGYTPGAPESDAAAA